MSSDDDRFDEDRYASIKLSEEGQRRFAAMAESPPKPTEAMKSLQALQNFEVTESEAGVGISPQDFNTLLAVLDTMVVSPPAGWESSEWLKGWMTTPVPALGGFSPAEVLRLPGGRDHVVKVLKCMVSGAFL